MTRKFLYVIVALTLMLALGGCGGGDSGAEATPTFVPTPPVPESQEYTVQRGDVVGKVEFTGRVTPVEMAALYFEVDGRVTHVYVSRNQEVSAGTVIAELDIEELLNELELAQVSLQAAQNTLNVELRNHGRSLKLAELDLRAAELQLAMAVAQSPEPDVTIARINLERAEAALAEAQEEYDKALARPWEGADALAGYQAWLDDARWNYEEAQAIYDQAIAQRKAHTYQVELLRGDVERAQLEVDWLKVGVDPVLTQTVQSAQLAVDGLQAQVDHARIVAPFDGRVLSLAIGEGSQAQAFRPVVTIAAGEGLEITGKPSDRELPDISVGMACEIERTSAPGEVMAGEVVTLPRNTGPVEDRDPNVHIRVPNIEETGLVLDDMVKVRVIVKERHAVLWLPPEAIRVYEGRRFVIVRDGEERRRVDVKLGVIGKERVEILEGLEEGQIVIAP